MSRLINLMVENHIILADQKEIYQYGLECLALKFIHYTTYILIAIYFHKLTELIMIYFIFGLIRKNAGGFHANTRLGCYFFSCIMLILFLLINNIYLNQFILLLTMFICNVVILKYAPVNNGNMKLDESEVKFFKVECRKILFLWDLIFLICVLVRVEKVSNIIAESYIMMLFLLLLGMIKNKCIKNE